VNFVAAEWSLGKDPEVMIEVWNTAALMEAVLEALLEDPQAMAKAVNVFRSSR
jgi:2-hydroxychromene-2-carboxylate isomerase